MQPLVRILAALSIIVAATSADAQRAARPATTNDLDTYVKRAVEEWKILGLAIAVVKDDSVIFAKGYGVRERGKPGAVDAGTRFAIGSTTKAMTAAALGMLVDDGKVRWDEPVITYLPGFRVGDPYVTRELTVRDLLTHRGGLGNADQLWASADYSIEEITRRVATLAPAYSLRSRFIHQNVMYAVAGEVVEAASGMTWATFLRTRIFTPLGMAAPRPRSWPRWSVEHCLTAYGVGGHDPRSHQPAGRRRRPCDRCGRVSATWRSGRASFSTAAESAESGS